MLFALFFGACKPENTSIVTKKTTKIEIKENKEVLLKTSLTVLVNDYIRLKNALVKDNSKDAVTVAQEILVSLTKIDVDQNVAHKDLLTDIIANTKENAEHIVDNLENLHHQREHFVSMSEDIIELINTFGTEKKLYQNLCSMFNKGKGAAWVSEVKDIQNPYYGGKMLTCGAIQKEFKDDSNVSESGS